MRAIAIVIVLAVLFLPAYSQSQPEPLLDDVRQEGLQLPQPQSSQFAVPAGIPDTVLYESLYQTWSDGWVNSSRTLCSHLYDAHGYEFGAVSQVWDDTVWTNRRRSTEVYDSRGLPIEFTSQQWNGASWDNSYRNIFTYNDSRYEVEYVLQRGNGTLWLNEFRRLTTYDDGNREAGVFNRGWSDSGWVLAARGLPSYNGARI